MVESAPDRQRKRYVRGSYPLTKQQKALIRTRKSRGVKVGVTVFSCFECYEWFHPRSYKVYLCNDCQYPHTPNPEFKRGVTVYKCDTCGEDFFPGLARSHTCDPCKYPTIRTFGRKMKVGDIFPCHNCCADTTFQKGYSEYCKDCQVLFGKLWDMDYENEVRANKLLLAKKKRQTRESHERKRKRLIAELGEEGYKAKVNADQRARYAKARKRGDVGGRVSAETREKWRKESGYTPTRVKRRERGASAA